MRGLARYSYITFALTSTNLVKALVTYGTMRVQHMTRTLNIFMNVIHEAVHNTVRVRALKCTFQM